MKRLIMFLCILFLSSCHNSLSLFKLNQKFINRESPLSDWEKDLLNARSEAFKEINMDFNSVDNLYLIEEYNIEGLYYSGLIYLNEFQYFHVSRKAVGYELEVLSKKLSNTELFIINELEARRYEVIKKKSRLTDVMSPSTLYITVAENKIKKHVRLFKLKEFYVD